MKVLFLGDIVGSKARKLISEKLSDIIAEEQLDFVVANAENAAAGSGITEKIARELFSSGIDIITLGDHAYRKKDIYPHFSTMPLVRPLNISRKAVGNGFVIKEKKGKKIAVVNLIGRVFMNPSDCPFHAIDDVLTDILKETKVIVVDIHAEATSEKVAMAHFLTQKVSAVLGTHTHIPTADERILNDHTAAITDVGMCGPCDSVIGRTKESIIDRFLTNMPKRFDLAENDIRLQGVIIEIDENSGRSSVIKRVEYR